MCVCGGGGVCVCLCVCMCGLFEVTNHRYGKCDVLAGVQYVYNQ